MIAIGIIAMMAMEDTMQYQLCQKFNLNQSVIELLLNNPRKDVCHPLPILFGFQYSLPVDLQLMALELTYPKVRLN